MASFKPRPLDYLQRELSEAVHRSYPRPAKNLYDKPYTRATAIFFHCGNHPKPAGSERLKGVFETVYGYAVQSHTIPSTSSVNAAKSLVTRHMKTFFDNMKSQDGFEWLLPEKIEEELLVIVYTGHPAAVEFWTADLESGDFAYWQPDSADILVVVDCYNPADGRNRADPHCPTLIHGAPPEVLSISPHNNTDGNGLSGAMANVLEAVGGRRVTVAQLHAILQAQGEISALGSVELTGCFVGGSITLCSLGTSPSVNFVLPEGAGGVRALISVHVWDPPCGPSMPRTKTAWDKFLSDTIAGAVPDDVAPVKVETEGFFDTNEGVLLLLSLPVEVRTCLQPLAEYKYLGNVGGGNGLLKVCESEREGQGEV